MGVGRKGNPHGAFEKAMQLAAAIRLAGESSGGRTYSSEPGSREFVTLKKALLIKVPLYFCRFSETRALRCICKLTKPDCSAASRPRRRIDNRHLG